MSCATSDYRAQANETHRKFINQCSGFCRAWFSGSIFHLLLTWLILQFMSFFFSSWICEWKSFLLLFLSAFPLKLTFLSRCYHLAINFTGLKELTCKCAKAVYSHRFFNPGATATGFKTLPFRIESSNCSRGDGLRFNGANFLSVAC